MDFDRSDPIEGQNRGLTPAAPPPSTPVTAANRLDELFGRWIRFIDVSPASVETYTWATRQFLRWLHEHGIANPCREDILTYRRHLEDTKRPTTVQLYITAVRQFFSWLEAEDVCKNVALHVKAPKIERLHKRDYLTADQIKNVLGVIERQSEKGRRDYAMLLLMVTCGLRRIEVCRANIEDIRPGGDCARLYIQGKGESEKAKYVKIPPTTELAIREYLTMRNRLLHSPAPLFASVSRNSYGQRLSRRNITEAVKTRLQAAGYNSDRLCAHSLRHTAVTLALLGGQPLQEVQMFARHTNITTTMIYAHNIELESNTCAQTVAGAIS